jgi:hypothetical protein
MFLGYCYLMVDSKLLHHKTGDGIFSVHFSTDVSCNGLVRFSNTFSTTAHYSLVNYNKRVATDNLLLTIGK